VGDNVPKPPLPLICPSIEPFIQLLTVAACDQSYVFKFPLVFDAIWLKAQNQELWMTLWTRLRYSLGVGFSSCLGAFFMQHCTSGGNCNSYSLTQSILEDDFR
jgi:hypothetical protein